MLPPTPQFANVNGVRLAYREWPGRAGAPPVLCLPHLTGHKGSFDYLAAALAPAYHVFALDLRGRGDSDRPAEGYGFAGHAQDLIAFADALGLGAFAVVGHSFGATTAVYLASVRPARVTALALLDGGADPKDETLQAMFPTIRRLDQVYPSLDAYLDAMRALPFFQPWNPALEQYFRADVALGPDGAVASKSAAAAIERDLKLHFYYSMCLHFPALRCPVLFVRPEQGLRGERGHVFSEAEAEAITRHIPRCRRASAPGVNHYTLLIHDHSPAVPAVRAFFDDVLRR
jgi:pimeloyl-ACP methyl ester carboxylesterase